MSNMIGKSFVNRGAFTMAQDNYNYGYKGVKAILYPAMTMTKV